MNSGRRSTQYTDNEQQHQIWKTRLWVSSLGEMHTPTYNIQSPKRHGDLYLVREILKKLGQLASFLPILMEQFVEHLTCHELQFGHRTG